MELENIFAQTNIADWVVTIIVWIGVFIWVWAVLWTTKDISLRTDNIFLQILSILLVAILTPIFWLLVYILIRPVNYKYDKIPWREALVLWIVQCTWCEWQNNKENKHCIFCWKWLNIDCKECKTKYPEEYEYCPNCWAPTL